MSFVDVDDIISINERLVTDIFKKAVGVELETPFKRITYSEAMDRYGSDKPDTRFGFELVDISDTVRECGFKVFTDAVANGGSVRLVNAKNCMDKFSRRDLDSLVEFVKIYRAKGMAWIVVTENELKSPITKFLSEDETSAILKKAGAETGDILLFIADKNEIVFDALGNLRLELARRLDIVDKSIFNFLWVTDFPLLEYDEEEKRYVAKHHPFTSPLEEDLALLDSDPSKVRAKAYDIVLNGVEIGGGSIRIHSTELQQKMFETLGFTREDSWERFGFLMEAFKYGTPPHGGIAYGLDRLVMLIAGCDSIRDVIAFPKVQNASELMSGAPSVVETKQLKELHIKLNA
jgi:aspartyl-tRNA synthetase